MTEEEKSFEEAMSELEAIIKKLEEADVPLEEAISYYEKGMALSKLCDEKLTKVERQVANIVNDEGIITPIKIEEE
ncbi:exodeoxyribonuclease VII small subunit [Amphibacillus sp. MSJ-3]|uniref:exodeoxyribonuclease VII small subunit n=1 Tax=Amphibacillus sp. MSJ-3 TaxID=2841505 RepID=UPI001C0EE979|nr:exodeoxyribonuclease VII small subunit [Amphibacillus sp. MSJ-3]MBU5594806.1 exodeoxyribonuclease VII small subunit [Amphibacillus sp. MSJ-3]